MNEMMQRLGINTNFTFALIFMSLIWVRLLTVVTVVPFLFGKPVPKSVRIGASLFLAFFAYRYLMTNDPPPITEDMLVIAVLFLKEAFIGVLIGFAAGLIFYGFEAAGQMIDAQRGMSIARLLIPELGTQSSLVGSFLFQLSVVVFLTMGGHHMFLNAVYGSYELLPVFQFPNVQPGLMPLMDFFMKITAQILVLSVQIAAPVIIAILIADIILGVANRIAPQINVWELGFNVKGYLGVLALFWAITIIVSQMEHYTLQSSSNLHEIIDYLRGVIPIPPLEKGG